MPIRYSEPLLRAWNRMVVALFRPFDFHKWIVVGFTAFLAGLMEYSSPGAGSRIHRNMNFSSFFDFPHTAWQWLNGHPAWFALIGFAVLALVALLISLTWLSSRGKFMFLDNVIHDRAEISKPWNEFARLGDSLFIWRLLFGLVVLAIIGTLAVYIFIELARLFQSGFHWSTALPALLGIGFLFFIFLLVIGFVKLLLRDFVVPVMYKKQIMVMPAWQIVLQLLGKNLVPILLYALFVLAIFIVIIICTFIVGLVTCCIGFIFVAIPYVRDVVLLPVSYTYRIFSLEFLRQFDQEFDLLSGQNQ